MVDPLTKGTSGPKHKYFWRFHHGNLKNTNVGGGGGNVKCHS